VILSYCIISGEYKKDAPRENGKRPLFIIDNCIFPDSVVSELALCPINRDVRFGLFVSDAGNRPFEDLDLLLLCFVLDFLLRRVAFIFGVAGADAVDCVSLLCCCCKCVGGGCGVTLFEELGDDLSDVALAPKLVVAGSSWPGDLKAAKCPTTPKSSANRDPTFCAGA
jgi:hypothetical protein